MTRYMVLPYKPTSEGAIALAEELDGLRIRLRNSEYEYRSGDCVINWGNGDSGSILQLPPNVMLNPNVNICINKKQFFERMQGHNIVPPFAFSHDEALRHLSFPIICRTRVEGADGDGIVIASESENLIAAPLYTQLMEKTAEYRVHLGRNFAGEIVLICAQKKRVGASHTNGHIWTGEHVFLDWCEPSELPRPVFDVTKRSMELMPELHFGGFDVIFRSGNIAMGNDAYVVEVNSAPMMTPDTTRKYAEFIRQYVTDRDEQARIDREELEMQQSNALLSCGGAPAHETADCSCYTNREPLPEIFDDGVVFGWLASGEVSLAEVVSGYVNWRERV